MGSSSIPMNMSIVVGKATTYHIFAKIQDIIVVEEHPVLYVQKFETIGIHSHLLAYQLSCMYSHTLLMVSSLYNKNTFSAHTFIGDGKLYITVKNNDVVNMLI